MTTDTDPAQAQDPRHTQAHNQSQVPHDAAAQPPAAAQPAGNTTAGAGPTDADAFGAPSQEADSTEVGGLPSSPGTSRNRLSRREALTLTAMCLGTMMTFLQITAMTSALGPIQDDLHVSPHTLVWVPSAYTLPVASLVLGTAQLGNRYGRKRLFLTGVTVLAVGAVLTALAPSTSMLITAQLISGVGGALVLPSSLAILGAAFPDPHRRTEVITAWAASSGVGLAIGPLIAGVLLAHSTWHTVLLSNLVLAAITAAVAVPVVAESRAPRGSAASHLDPAGLLLGTVAIAALVYGLIDGQHSGYGSGRILTVWAVALLAAVLLIRVELRVPTPMLDVRLFRSASFSAVMTIAAVSLFGFTGVAILTVLFDEKVQGLSPLHMAWQVLALFGVYVIVAYATGRAVRRVGFRLPLTAGLTLGGAASLGLATIDPGTSYGHVWPWLAVFGASCGLAAAPATAAALVSVSHNQAGMASGAVNAFRQLGSVLGSSLLGTLLTSRFTTHLPTELTARRVPRAVQKGVIDAVTTGSTSHRSVTLPAPTGAAVTHALNDAFTSGIHAGYAVNGLVWLAAAVLAVTVVRNRPHA